MPVNGIELKEGQVWTTTSFGNVTLSKKGVSTEYPWYCSSDECDFSITKDGKYWEEDDMPILLELIKEETTANKFNPQPGDKIICNNGKEFICCTLEFLQEKISHSLHSSKSILGYDEDCNEWQDWNHAGFAYGDDDYAYNIREVIPAESKEVVKEEEPRYTLEEIKEAWNASGWVAATTTWNTFRGNLVKNDAEYQEYLRLKAIYE